MAFHALRQLCQVIA